MSLSKLVLKPGDTVDIIAPGFGSKVKEISQAVEFVKSIGLIPKIDKNIVVRGKKADLLCAASDEERFRQLKNALLSSNSKAIWCLRGGYGSGRLLNYLLKLKKPNKQKLFIGLSDITILHAYFNLIWDWPTIHGPMVEHLGMNPKPRKEITRLIMGKTDSLKFPLKPLNQAAIHIGSLKACVYGGNLTCLQSLLGTELKLNFKNQILFLEDVSERGYRVDRMLMQLEMSGAFKDLRALIFGPFVGGNEPDGNNLVIPVIKRFSEHLKIPVFHGVHSGHGPYQRPLILNQQSRIEKSTGNFQLHQTI